MILMKLNVKRCDEPVMPLVTLVWILQSHLQKLPRNIPLPG